MYFSIDNKNNTKKQTGNYDVLLVLYSVERDKKHVKKIKILRAWCKVIQIFCAPFNLIINKIIRKGCKL